MGDRFSSAYAEDTNPAVHNRENRAVTKRSFLLKLFNKHILTLLLLVYAIMTIR